MGNLVADLRRFNRRWTRVMGLLERGILETDLTLTEARVLYELGQQRNIQRQRLRDDLGLDGSYLTRILKRFERDGLVGSTRSAEDRRSIDLQLTEVGRAFVTDLESRSDADIGRLLAALSPAEGKVLGEALTVAANLVVPGVTTDRVEIRDARPGDFGWIISRHGALYDEMFGWSEHFEGTVARIVSDFLETRNPIKEHAWIAELDGARAGCILCSQRTPEVGQLRVLLVEPWSRGRGIGRELIETCVAFAERAGYRRIVLETDASLETAIHLYQSAGFALLDERPDKVHGTPEDAQVWALDLPRSVNQIAG